ncbi:MAG: tetratricopeptide repeat protein, partial [Candidatus Rokuibacteriota bacterium]
MSRACASALPASPSFGTKDTSAVPWPGTHVRAGWTTGELLAVRGDWEEGIERCQRALEISPDPLDTANARGHLGSAYLEAGEPGQAIPFLEQAVHQFGQFRGGQAHGWYTMLLGAAHLAKGDLEGARARTLAAVDILEAAQYRRGIAWARRTLGPIAERAGALAEAEERLQEALTIFTEISARFEVARTHLALAELARRRGDAGGAAQHLGDRLRSLLRAGRPPLRRADRADGGGIRRGAGEDARGAARGRARSRAQARLSRVLPSDPMTHKGMTFGIFLAPFH